ncbi:MAG: (2E,6E)-farnesyl diphosphate synthase [Gammaproteobacteria bacterium]
MNEIVIQLAEYKTRVEDVLNKVLPSDDTLPTNLHKAMRYAVLGSGKRIRAALVYAMGQAYHGNLANLDIPASMIEIAHAASMVHDDLPALDNDDLRRGKPSCHKMFDEATAILAGDALLMLCYRVLSAYETPDVTLTSEQRLMMVQEFSLGSGSLGLMGGELLDIEGENKKLSIKEIERIYLMKTGKFFEIPIVLGLIAAGIKDATQIKLARDFAHYFGLAFQIQDDCLELSVPIEQLGKSTNSDHKLNKATYPSVLGSNEAEKLYHSLYEKSYDVLKQLPCEQTVLINIVNYVNARRY